MEKHRGEEGGQKNEIRDGDEDWDDNENGDNNNDDDEDDDEDDDDNDYYDDDKNADDEDADDEDADDDNDDDEDATDAKTTISCLYWLHDAASGCDILQTIWSIYACFAPLRIMMILSSSYYRALCGEWPQV